eukprot:776700-Rhodomonas_salina.3
MPPKKNSSSPKDSSTGAKNSSTTKTNGSRIRGRPVPSSRRRSLLCSSSSSAYETHSAVCFISTALAVAQYSMSVPDLSKR